MAEFWWSNAEHSNKIHWLSWEKLCLPKDQGGLGFRDIKTFNQALLAKLAWRILQYPDCLFAQVMKSRYFPSSEFLTANIGTRPSYAWKSILHGRELLIQGLTKKIGNGKSVRVWMDDWIEDEGMRAPYRKNSLFNPDLRVKALIDWSKRGWDPQKLHDHFLPEDIQRIQKIKPVTECEDFYVWKHNKSGDFSVKSAYWLASQSNNIPLRVEANMCPSTNDLKSKVWGLQTDPKLKVFLWKVLCGALPVVVSLNKRGIKMDQRCVMCGGEEETINHMLFSCSLSRQIWALTGIPSPQGGFHNGSVFSNIQYMLVNKDNISWPEELRKCFPWILWRIWKNRNLVSFEGKCFSALESAQKVKEDWMEWSEAQKPEEVGGAEEERVEPIIVERQRGRVLEETRVWVPPPSSWLKCNIGSSWSKRNKLAGSAWVLRNQEGRVLLHSRRAFANIADKKESQFMGLIWAMESMRSHKVEKVIFALQDPDLVGAITKPAVWPSFRYQSMEAGIILKSFKDWKIFLENSSSNRGAFLIAQSVTNDCRLQSYVAANHPSWLASVFADERVLAPD